MTVQEAQAEINKCEQKITSAHSSLCSAARVVGSSARDCADGRVLVKILLMVISFIVGIIFVDGFGGVLIIVGVVIAISMESTISVLKKVKAEQKTLDGTIDNNSEI